MAKKQKRIFFKTRNSLLSSQASSYKRKKDISENVCTVSPFEPRNKPFESNTMISFLNQYLHFNRATQSNHVELTDDIKTLEIAPGIQNSRNYASDTVTVSQARRPLADNFSTINKIHRNASKMLNKVLATFQTCYKVTWVGYLSPDLNQGAHALSRELNHRAPEHAQQHPKKRGTQP